MEGQVGVKRERKKWHAFPLAFSLCELPLKFNIVDQNLGSESGDLVHVFGPLMGKLSHFCANVSSAVKRFSKTLDEKIKTLSQNDALWRQAPFTVNIYWCGWGPHSHL